MKKYSFYSMHCKNTAFIPRVVCKMITEKSYHWRNKGNSAREGREAINSVGVDLWELAGWFDSEPM